MGLIFDSGVISGGRIYGSSEGSGGGTDSLTATGITTGQPTLGSPAIGQRHALTASGVTTGQPTLGSPSIGQRHVLSVVGITTGQPAIGSPTLNGVPGAVDILAVGIATAAPTLGTPALGQRHVLAAVGITTGAPVVGNAPPAAGPAVLGSLSGTKKRSYPQRPANKQTGDRY